MKRNVIIALVLTASLATGIGAGFIYSNHVAKSMVSNNVVATEQNAANEASKSEDVAARENAKNVSSDKKAADTKTDKTSAKAADKKTKTEKTAAKASVNKQNTQKAVKAKTENHKASAKSENNTDHVLITAEPKKEEAAIQKTALKTAEEKKAENTVKAEIEMSEEEWSKIADQRMRERYEESMRFCAENMNKDADDEEGATVCENEIAVSEDDENVSEEEWNEIVDQRMRERYEASMKAYNSYENVGASHEEDATVCENEIAVSEDDENVSEEEWNEIVEQRMCERYEASMMSYTEDEAAAE